ncbi:C39 family peptidase [Lyngbya aestuarii]|uniref:C39 family peptidase n=1 Tax=Lyngbya aestuarii TaxID=118322 RepID=UPI00403D951A
MDTFASQVKTFNNGSLRKLPLPGVELIKKFEGCRLQAYPDPITRGKPYAIGWGCTQKKDGSEWSLGDQITQEEADELLIYQLEKNYLPSLEKIPVWQELNINQRGALLSFAYNLGAYFYGGENFQTITKVLKSKRWDKIKSALLLYRNPGSRAEAGLRRRRLAEAQLFLTQANTFASEFLSQELIESSTQKLTEDKNTSLASNSRPTLWLSITQDTIAKQSALRSEELPDSEKEYISAGHRFQILNYQAIASKIGPHIGVTFISAITLKERSTWVFYQHHIEIVQDDGKKLIGKHSERDSLPSFVNLPISYFSQRDNRFQPQKTCNVTSVAMCLYYYGIRPQNRDEQLEDELFQLCQQHGWNKYAHNHLAKVFQVYGIQDRFKIDATWQEVKAHLANKNPVIYSGKLTHSGHIIVLRGYDDTGFWVNDPWGEYFPSGYQSNKSGENLHYSYDLLKRVSMAGQDKTWAHFPEKR